MRAYDDDRTFMLFYRVVVDRAAVVGFFLPICQPQRRSTLTTLGVMAAVRGTRMKMKLL